MDDSLNALLSVAFDLVSLSGSKVLLGSMVVRLDFERILETNNGLIQPVETQQHHTEVQMTGDMTGIDF